MTGKKRLNITLPDWDDEPADEPEPVFHKTLAVARLVEGRGQVAFAGTTRVALFRVKGEIHAIRNACPHAGAPLSGGSCRGELVTCPRHGWLFNLRTGACLTQAMYALKTYPVRVEDGFVWVGV